MNNDFRTLTRRWTAANLGLTALLAALLLLNHYGLQPQLREAALQSQERSALNDELLKAKADRDSLAAQEERLGSEETRLQQFRDSGLPGPLQAQSDLQRVIHRALADAGVRTQSVRYTETDTGEKKNLRRRTADFAVSGSYAELKALLGALERAPEFVLVDDFNFTSQPGKPGEPGGDDNLMMQVKLSVFFQNNRLREDRRGT